VRVRVIAPVLPLPSFSYFSSSEIFIAEELLSEHQKRPIKLVYDFLPYQHRLSEYCPKYPELEQLQVTRDATCKKVPCSVQLPRTTAEHDCIGAVANKVRRGIQTGLLALGYLVQPCQRSYLPAQVVAHLAWRGRSNQLFRTVPVSLISRLHRDRVTLLFTSGNFRLSKVLGFVAIDQQLVANFGSGAKNGVSRKL